jgi:hypothetical protein
MGYVCVGSCGFIQDVHIKSQPWRVLPYTCKSCSSVVRSEVDKDRSTSDAVVFCLQCYDFNGHTSTTNLEDSSQTHRVLIFIMYLRAGLLSCIHSVHNTHIYFQKLTPQIRILLQMFEIVQLVKKFSTFYGMPKLMKLVTRTRHWTTQTIESIQSGQYLHILLESKLVTSSHIRLKLN